MVNPGWADLDRGLFSISVAADLAGLHPQTLRIYEREGLIDPARSAGGTRRYSRRDLGRLQEICALTADGLNLAGIRRVLELQEETRRLQAELAALRERAGGNGKPGRRPVRRAAPALNSPGPGPRSWQAGAAPAYGLPGQAARAARCCMGPGANSHCAQGIVRAAGRDGRLSSRFQKHRIPECLLYVSSMFQ